MEEKTLWIVKVLDRSSNRPPVEFEHTPTFHQKYDPRFIADVPFVSESKDKALAVARELMGALKEWQRLRRIRETKLGNKGTVTFLAFKEGTMWQMINVEPLRLDQRLFDLSRSDWTMYGDADGTSPTEDGTPAFLQTSDTGEEKIPA